MMLVECKINTAPILFKLVHANDLHVAGCRYSTMTSDGHFVGGFFDSDDFVDTPVLSFELEFVSQPEFPKSIWR